MSRTGMVGEQRPLVNLGPVSRGDSQLTLHQQPCNSIGLELRALYSLQIDTIILCPPVHDLTNF
jgi:hypothetical protein